MEGFRKQLMRPTARELGALVGVFAVRTHARRRRHTRRQTNKHTCLPRHVIEKVCQSHVCE